MAIMIMVTANLTLVGSKASKKISPTMTISANNISHPVSDGLYGLSLENEGDAIDSGLVANLVNNNSFEYEKNPVASWNLNTKEYELLSKGGLSKSNETFLSVTIEGTGAIENNGHHEFFNYKTYQVNQKTAKSADMGFKANKTYMFSAYFKNEDYTGTITLSLSAEGNKEKYQFNLDTCEDWTKINLEIKSDVTADGSMLLTCEGNGTFYMDYATLVPEDSYGYNVDKWAYTSLKPETVTAIKQLSPSFIRFSTGELDERKSLKELGSWKDTVGPVESRKQSYSYNDKGVYYINSNMMGMYEYLVLCEDVGAIPIPVLNSGIMVSARKEYKEMAEKYSKGSITDKEWQEYLDKIALRPESKEFDKYVESILDLIEYANGDETTEWGAKRIEDGHPEPFNIQMIALGNGHFGDLYWRNFDAIYNKITENYPEIQIVSCIGNDDGSKEQKHSKETANKYSDIIISEHYNVEGGTLFKNAYKYDNYDRSGAKIMVGEYGVNTKVGDTLTKNNIWSAIENAAFLTGVERNSDMVKMISYSTFLSKINAQTTDTSMVWFNSGEIVYTPDYYTQMIFANNIGTSYVNTDFNMEEKGIYQSVTVDTEEKVIYVKLVNSTRKTQRINISVEGFNNPNNPSVQYMSETFKSACNEPGQQLHVAPVEARLQIDNNVIPYNIEGYSISVIRIPYDTNNGSDLYKLPIMPIISPYIPPMMGILISCGVVLLAVIMAVIILLVRMKSHKKALAEAKKSEEEVVESEEKAETREPDLTNDEKTEEIPTESNEDADNTDDTTE